MLPYWLLFFGFSLGALTNRRAAHPGQAGVILIIGAVIIALMIGLRVEVGGDWVAYIRIFDAISSLRFTEALTFTEPAYGLVNWVSDQIGTDIWGVNLVCALVFTIGLVVFTKHQPNPWLAVLVAIPFLVIVVAMGYTRQSAAIGLVMVALARLQQGRLVATIFWVLVAATFHRSAVVMLPIVGLVYSRNYLQTIILGIFAALIGYFILLAPAIEQYSRGYVENVYQASGAGIRLAMNVVPAIIFLMMSRRISLNDVDRKLWRNFSIVAVVSFALLFFVASDVAIDRIGLYIIPLQLVVFNRLPLVLSHNQGSEVLLRGVVIGYSAAVQFVWLTFADNAEAWLPYRFYLFEA